MAIKNEREFMFQKPTPARLTKSYTQIHEKVENKMIYNDLNLI